MTPRSAPSLPLLSLGCCPIAFPCTSSGAAGALGPGLNLPLVLFTTDISITTQQRPPALSKQQGALAILGPLERVKTHYLCAAASKATLLEA